MKRFPTLLAALSFLLGATAFTTELELDMKNEVSTERAILAGGCFWCVESALEQLDGVEKVISGYTGGDEINPNYKQVSSGSTGHTEAVEVYFDPQKISYEQLLETFWKIMDPTDAGGQFVDRGQQYRSGIFYLNEEQRVIAERSKQNLAETSPFDRPIVTEITRAGPFYRAEKSHQDYYSRNPIRYKLYTYRSGRKEFTEKYWTPEH
jgi:peptide methionine sulfoxide reductase msrA/msrB